MYSAADLPSSMRAAPAKKRIWSTAGGISSLIVSAIGLPVFWLSTATNSSARDSSASAILSRARCRSDGVVSRHDSKAVAAAPIAASTSAAPETGAVANVRPVVGSIRSAEPPSFVSTNSPLTKLRKLVIFGLPYVAVGHSYHVKRHPYAILATESVADKGAADCFRSRWPGLRLVGPIARRHLEAP